MFAVYGLVVASDWALDLPAARPQEPADVELRLGDNQDLDEAAKQAQSAPRAASWFLHAKLPDGRLYLRWTDLFEFLISHDGHSVWGRALANATDESFQVYLLNQVLSFALLRQNIEQLHATVLVVGDVAVALVGDSGYGKSTLAAAFLAAGDRILTDDLLLVRRSGEDLLAYPGPRRIKLFPEIARALLPELAGATPLNAATPKLVIPLPAQMAVEQPAPLRAIYMLTAAGRVRTKNKVMIRKPGSPQAFLALVRNTFNPVIEEPERLRAQFEWAMGIAARVPIRALSYPRDLSRIGEVRESVVADVKRNLAKTISIRPHFPAARTGSPASSRQSE